MTGSAIEGVTPADAVEIAHLLNEAGVDICDVSAGQTSTDAQPVYGRMFQTPFSDRIRNEVGMATMAVGNIYEPDHVNSILMAGRADLVCLARPHLADPYWTLHAAVTLGDRGVKWPDPYLPGRDQALPAGRARGSRFGAQGMIAGRHALVTGGGSGVGRAIALALAGAGVAVTICGRREEALAEVASQSDRIVGIAADVTDEAAMAALYEKAEAARGPIDIVVANAGMAGSAPAAKTTLADWQRTLDVNLTGAFLTVQPALAGMAERRAGRIVFIASTAGLKGYAYVAPYVAAKHGVVGLMRALAAETREDRRHRQCGLPGLRRDRHARGERRHASSRRPAARRRKRAPACAGPTRRAA